MRASFIVNEIGIGLRRNLIMTIAMIITTAVSLGFALRVAPWPRHDEESASLAAGPTG